jgi:hypothetical protein
MSSPYLAHYLEGGAAPIDLVIQNLSTTHFTSQAPDAAIEVTDASRAPDFGGLAGITTAVPHKTAAGDRITVDLTSAGDDDFDTVNTIVAAAFYGAPPEGHVLVYGNAGSTESLHAVDGTVQKVSGNVWLTQQHTLVIDNLTTAHSVQSPTLTQDHQLAVQNLATAHSESVPTISGKSDGPTLNFTGATAPTRDEVICDYSLGAVTAFTVAMLIRFDSVRANGELTIRDSGTDKAHTNAFSNGQFWWSSAGGFDNSPWNYLTDEWVVIAVTHGATTEQVRFHQVSLDDPTYTPDHADGDNTTITGIDAGTDIHFGTWDIDDENHVGDLAYVGIWDNELSDGDIENLTAVLKDWHDLSPSRLWYFSGDPVNDLMNSGDDETSRPGNATEINDGPLNFDPSLGVTLVVDNLSTAHSIQAPAITQVHSLTVQGLATAHALGTPALTQVHSLTVQALATAHQIGSPTLTQVHSLAVQGLATAHSIENVVLNLVTTLVIQNLATAHALPAAGALTQVHFLVPANLATAHALGVPTLSQIHQLDVDDLETLHSLGHVLLFVPPPPGEPKGSVNDYITKAFIKSQGRSAKDDAITRAFITGKVPV